MGTVTMRQVRTISRKGWAGASVQNPQRPYAGHRNTPVKRWSDLHGDMQSQAEREMTWPLAAKAVSGNNSVGPYPVQP